MMSASLCGLERHRIAPLQRTIEIGLGLEAGDAEAAVELRGANSTFLIDSFAGMMDCL